MATIFQYLPNISFPLVSSLVAALFALISFFVSRRTERRQMAVQSQDLLLQFDMAVRDWGRVSIETLTLLEAAAWQKDEYEFNKMVARVSGMIDQGRLLLPNTPRFDRGDSEKPEAYKGYRPPVLDNLYAVYDYASGLTPENLGKEAATELFSRRRAFVAELVVALDTKRNKQVMHRLDATVRSQFSTGHMQQL